MLETASFHIVKPCNFGCKYCYARFEDMNVQQIPLENAKIVVDKLSKNGVRKITFAGGEPLLYKHIKEIIKYTKEKGLTTSIITNGSLLTDSFLNEMQGYLDWIGISIDSLNLDKNHLIGRRNKSTSHQVNYKELIYSVQYYNYKLKINTVVNDVNIEEDFTEFMLYALPQRWKILQALKIDGQNDKDFDQISCSDENFNFFVNRHKRSLPNINIVPENNDMMTGSYLLIDPQGRLFDNTKGTHTYSDSLVYTDFNICLSQVSYNRKTFIQRGGIYNW